MRWFVEVSRVGDSAPAERYCVDAKAWQAALQESRKLRGDAGPLSKFSIELLDDGYRAVDPVQKIRYLVSQAPADAPLMMTPPPNGASHPAPSPVGAAAAPVAVSVPHQTPHQNAAVPTPVASVVPAAASVPAPALAASASMSSSISSLRSTGSGSVVPTASGGLASALATSSATAHVAAPRMSGSAAALREPVKAAESLIPRPAVPRPASTRAPAAAPPAVADAVVVPAVNPAPVATPPGSSPTAAPAPAPSMPAAVPERPVAADVWGGEAEPSSPAANAAPLASAGAGNDGASSAPSIEIGAPISEPPSSTPDTFTVDPGLPTPSSASALRAATEVAPDAAPITLESPGTTQPTSVPVGGEVPTLKLLRKRAEEPTPQAPITYREEAYAVPPGVDREHVEVILRERFSALRADLAGSPPGQLVQLAVFDHEFTDRPLRPPLGTLAWKDWRGDPVFGFPAFGESVPPLSSRMPPPSDASQGAASASAQSNGAATAPAASPEIPTGEAAPAVRASGEVAPPAEPVASASLPPVSAPSAASEPTARASKPRLVVARRREAGEDLITELFELMHELHFARDIASGADFVLNVLDEVIPSEISMIQVFDINTRNFVVVRARGSGAERALMHATPDTDPQIVELMRRERSRAFQPNGESGFGGGRWGFIRKNVSQVLSGPVRQGGRYLGLIEIANPYGGAPFHESEVNAFDYICEQFADFVASRPIVLEADVILGR
jgi:hypothetical protein